MVKVRRPQRFPLLLVGAFAALLSGCAVTFVPGGGVDAIRPTPPNTVVRPDPTPSRPTVGRPVLPDEGSILNLEVDPRSISPGTSMRFRVRIAHPGYLTVSTMAPDGRVEVVLRNVPVVPGQQFVPALDAPPDQRLRASAPSGMWIVRAQFAEARTAARFPNVQGYDAWSTAIAEDLSGAPRASVFETRFEVEDR